jgi:hypothetical protein
MNKRKRVAWEKHRKTKKKIRDKRKALKVGGGATARAVTA